MAVGYFVHVHQTYLTNIFLKCLLMESNDYFETRWRQAVLDNINRRMRREGRAQEERGMKQDGK